MAWQRVGLCARALRGRAGPRTTTAVRLYVRPQLIKPRVCNAHDYVPRVDRVRADLRKIVFTNQEMLGFTKISRVRKLVVLQYTKQAGYALTL